jgi:hypothetical protein
VASEAIFRARTGEERIKGKGGKEDGRRSKKRDGRRSKKGVEGRVKGRERGSS